MNVKMSSFSNIWFGSDTWTFPWLWDWHVVGQHWRRGWGAICMAAVWTTHGLQWLGWWPTWWRWCRWAGLHGVLFWRQGVAWCTMWCQLHSRVHLWRLIQSAKLQIIMGIWHAVVGQNIRYFLDDVFKCISLKIICLQLDVNFTEACC